MPRPRNTRSHYLPEARRRGNRIRIGYEILMYRNDEADTTEWLKVLRKQHNVKTDVMILTLEDGTVFETLGIARVMSRRGTPDQIRIEREY